MDVTFSGTTLSRTSRQITIEFIAMRPVRVAYQVVYQRDGKWEFDHAQLIYDEAERFTAYGDQPGAISAGRKVRTLTLGELDEGVYGYAMVQLVTIDQGKLTVHAGRVISIPPDAADMTLTASVADTFSPAGGRELSIFIGHEYPCALSVSIWTRRIGRPPPVPSPEHPSHANEPGRHGAVLGRQLKDGSFAARASTACARRP